MKRQISNIILIEVDSDERRAARLFENSVQEIVIERTSSPSKIGNIYTGKVENVNEAIKAAFVNIGIGRNCFLPLEDYPQPIAKGSTVFVQVVKDAFGSKPPRLTGFPSFAGRFLIFMPKSPKGGISRNLVEKERVRLREILEKVRKKFQGSWIVRTQAAEKTEKEIFADAEYLFSLWQKVSRKKVEESPSFVARVYDFTEKILADFVNNETRKILVEPEEEFKKAQNFIKKVIPEKRKNIFLGVGAFEKYGVENEIRNLTKPLVRLPSGGEIVIQSTEALTAVDVNSARLKKNLPQEEMAFLTNREAAREILRQLRLRNIGGIIVCDMIDMKSASYRKEIFKTFEDASFYDRAKIEILPPNKMGLVVITRQRLEENLIDKITSPCRHCEGSGRQLSPTTMFIRIKRHLLKNRKQYSGGGTLNIFVNPVVAEMFDEKTIEETCQLLKRNVKIRSDYKISQQEYKIE